AILECAKKCTAVGVVVCNAPSQRLEGGGVFPNKTGVKRLVRQRKWRRSRARLGTAPSPHAHQLPQFGEYGCKKDAAGGGEGAHACQGDEANLLIHGPASP